MGRHAGSDESIDAEGRRDGMQELIPGLAPHDAAKPPAVRMYELLYSSLVSQLLIAVAELGVADCIEAGPVHVKDLAARTNSDPEALYRAMRALATVGVFTETSPQTFDTTPLGDTLRSDSEGSMRDLAAYVGLRERQAALNSVLHSVRSGGPAFDHVHGMDWWSYMSDHPELSTLFNRAMGSMARMVNTAALGVVDLKGVRRLVDVGGGRGHLVAAALQRYPALKAVLLDLPHVIPEAKELLGQAGVLDRVECVGGDFLKSVPGGGDLYVLCWTLHDWNDEDSVAILSNIRSVMDPDGTLLVIDEVIPEGDTPHFGKFEDIVMLSLLKGRVRTEKQFVSLFEAAGLRLVETRDTSSTTSAIIAAPR